MQFTAEIEHLAMVTIICPALAKSPLLMTKTSN